MTRPARRRDEGGTVAVVVAVLALVLFGMAAFVVDLGYARDVRREAQNAADAAALAAGNQVYLNSVSPQFTAAVTAAKAAAQANYAYKAIDWSSCAADPATSLAYVPDTSAKCISFDSATAPTEARVTLPQTTVPTSFGGLFGRAAVAVNGAANIRLTQGGTATCGLCVLGPGVHDLQNGSVTVAGGTVSMNGTVTGQNNGGVSVTGGTLAVQNGTDPGNHAVFSPAITPGIPVTDPFSSITMPSLTGLVNKASANPCSGGPGIYSNFNAATTCTLAPGLYVITGATQLSGSGHDLAGTGVTLYFMCGTSAAPTTCTSANSWNFDLSSQQVHLDITAPTSNPVSNAMTNVAIIADRGWTGTLAFQGGGGGNGTTTGSIYLAAGTLAYGGNTQSKSLNSGVVVADINENGNPAAMNINYVVGQSLQKGAKALHLCYKASVAVACT